MTPLVLGSLFTGQLVRLGAQKAEEKELLAKWSHDAEFLRQLNFDPAVPRAASFFEDKKKDDGRSFQFAIRTLTDDQMIGFTGLSVQWTHQTAWFWIGIGEPDYRSKGYGTDTTCLMLSYAFRELGLHRVGLGVFSYNTRAQRVYEKAGFTYEGTQRAALYRDGQRYDVIGMAVLRPEWEAQQQAEPVADAVR